MIAFTFYMRRLHSLCGLTILGAFLIKHILINANVISPKFGIPFEREIVAVFLLFHGIYGIYIALQARNNAWDYPFAQNIRFSLQRMTSWYLTGFLIYHVFYMDFYVPWSGAHISFQLLRNHVGDPVHWVMYLLGFWAAIFHFCNGITTFFISWGIAKGSRIQRVINCLSMLLCFLLCLVSLVSMLVYLQ